MDIAKNKPQLITIYVSLNFLSFDLVFRFAFSFFFPLFSNNLLTLYYNFRIHYSKRVGTKTKQNKKINEMNENERERIKYRKE